MTTQTVANNDYSIPENFRDLHPIDTKHRDACALICAVRKGGQATHGNVKRTIEALARMGHRTGYINGEGDGVGILTDIPRQLWTKRLAQAGLRASLATDRNFWVAHVMINAKDRNRSQPIIEQICRRISEVGLHLLIDEKGIINGQVLGPNAEKNEPVFWQIAGINGQIHAEDLERTLFNLQVELEDELGIHFASFSSHSVVYKVQGTIEILRRYYPELRDPDYASTVTLGHARYSTNTNPVFERCQPFGILGHNGEFNTISRFRIEAGMLGIPLSQDNSDSQDVDRVLQSLCMHYGLDLIEAMEYIFPSYSHDLIQSSPEIPQVYEEIRHSFGRFAQGPAGIVARLDDLTVFSVDALGLRPLWFGETEKEFFASSERGVYPLDVMSVTPKPMAPGEKIALRIKKGETIDVLDYPAIQRHVFTRYRERFSDGTTTQTFWSLNVSSTDTTNGSTLLPTETPPSGNDTLPQMEKNVATLEKQQIAITPTISPPPALPWNDEAHKLNAVAMSAFGWERYHVEIIKTIAEAGKERIDSLGWDGPLAALSNTRVNLADYFKETVAVVTNPAIDREREQAQFSTQVLIGVRPEIGHTRSSESTLVQLETPFLLGGHPALGASETMQTIATQYGTMTLEQLLEVFGQQATILSLGATFEEGIERAIERLQRDAIEAVLQGAQCLILDDSIITSGDSLWIDPLLATSAVDKALRHAEYSPNLRRQAGIVVRSGGLRDLHDMALCISFGANALVPYAVYGTAIGITPKPAKIPPTEDYITECLSKVVSTLTKGLEKVTSTIGCHDLRGYGHSFSSIGFGKHISKIFGTPNYFGSESRGVTWESLTTDAEERASECRGEVRARLQNPDRLYPKMWKKAEAVAHGELSLEEYTEHLLNLEEKMPVSIRHILGIKTKSEDQQIKPEDVDIRVKDHDMPVIISAMSFGSQGELAYRTYAEAAKELNIICMNGEGGELRNQMRKFSKNRGQQIASGRFGVNIDLLNSDNYLEIKIGQGAKPGEGGHLPGFKVTEQIAEVRSTMPGVALISPSNNHDLYSIEDLAQLIDELKTANPNAKVSVKIPVVPGVGIIAVGVAKAGADIITVTGYTGGTGAARSHALRHVGLPAEIGLWLSHRALIESGLRGQVELWCDGGMKSGRDVVKMLCLGADRVGFGTLAMVAVGCTICRGCQDGTCHVGITTHVQTKEEAEHKNFKAFRPFHERGSVESLTTMFRLLGEDICKWTAKLGVKSVRDLVGHTEYLEQMRLTHRLDLTPLLQPVPPMKKKPAQPGGRRITRPRNTVSKQITDIVNEYVSRGDYELTYDDEQVMAMDRALGTHLAGAISREDIVDAHKIEAINLSFSNSAIPGNGLGAFSNEPINILVEGGAQDGVGKCAKGGNFAILKGLNHNGKRLDGSVGKSFAYGAQGGLFVVQGDADTRACIRMSGADVIFGGEVQAPLHDELGAIGTRANLKGYAFEYMTSGRALVLGSIRDHGYVLE